MRALRKVVGFSVVLLALAASLRAQGGRWQYLGEANVDGQADHDRIEIGRSKGAYRAIKMAVQNGPIEFDRAVAHYGDGSSNRIPMAMRIPAGGETRTIELPGGNRVLESVEFWYRKGFPNSAKPKVRLFGMH